MTEARSRVHVPPYRSDKLNGIVFQRHDMTGHPCLIRGAGPGSAALQSRINRMLPGKDWMITRGDYAPVFSELHQVTCGRAVQKPVDNRRDMRISGGILWTTCGCEKNPK